MMMYAPKVINVDNQCTISLDENPIHHARTKHLDVQLQFVRNSIENGVIELNHAGRHYDQGTGEVEARSNAQDDRDGKCFSITI